MARKKKDNIRRYRANVERQFVHVRGTGAQEFELRRLDSVHRDMSNNQETAGASLEVACVIGW